MGARRALRLPCALMLLVLLPAAAAQTIAARIQDHRVFVPTRVDGRGPYRFLVDTGSSGTTLEDALRKKLALRPIDRGVGEGAGEAKVPFETYQVASIAVGHVTFGPIDAPAFDNRTLAAVIGFEAFDGVVGVELFKRAVVTLDARRSEVVLSTATPFRPVRGARRVSFALSPDDVPVVEATINGVPGLFEIDTGDRSAVTLYGPFWRQHRLESTFDRTVTAQTGYGLGGPILSLVGRARSFVFGNVDARQPVVRLSLQRAGAFTASTYAGSIGMGLLARYRCSFDYQHKALWLEPATTDDDAPYDRSGAWIGFAPGGLGIVSVVHGGPAEQAGLHPVDVLRSIDGIAATPANLPALRRLLASTGRPGVRVRYERAGRPAGVRIALRDLIAPVETHDR